MDNILAWIERQNPSLAWKITLDGKAPSGHFPKVTFTIQEDVEVLYIQGVIRCFETIRPFIQKGGIVVFVEGNLQKLAAFFQLTEFSPEEGIEICLPEEGEYTRIAWKHLFKKGQYVGDLSPLKEVQNMVHMVASDYREGGKMPLRNIQLNLLRTRNSIDGRSLRGAYQGAPIVVCGSGESLMRSLDGLRQVQDRVLILAVGSAIPILQEANIRIDFGAFIDPDPPLDKYIHTNNFPLFYQNRTSEGFLQIHRGEKIWMGSSGGFPLEDWIYQEGDVPKFPFDSGWNVGTFGVHIAHFLGGSPIILVGLDASMEKIRPLKEGEFIQEGRITRRDLSSGIQWIEAFLIEHPDCEIIQGFEHLKIKGAVVDLEWEKRIPSVELQKEIAHKKLLKIDRYQIQKTIAKIYAPQFLEAFEGFLATLAKGVDKRGFDLATVILEGVLSGEPFYEYLLLPLWEMFKGLYSEKGSQEVEEAIAKVCFFQKISNEVLLQGVRFFDEPLSRTLFVEGKVEGEVVRKYPSGSIAAIEEYIASKPTGKWEMFYETGEIKSAVEFGLGKLDGKFDLFYKTGKKREGIFKAGIKEGKHQIYTEEGKTLFQAAFKEGTPCGEWKRYSYQGNIVEETTYLEDLRFSRREYTEEGDLKYEGGFEGDRFIEKKLYEDGSSNSREGIWEGGKIVWK